MKQIMLVLVIFIVGLAQADVYKYTNKQGKTAYSDVPMEGSIKVIVPPIMTYKPPVLPKKSPGVNKIIPEKLKPYEGIYITSPSEEGTIISNEGIVSVAYAVEPFLKKGHTVEWILDGINYQGNIIEGVDRGEHTIQIQVVNLTGEVQIISSETVFYMRHHTSLL
ncbi:MAG: DUF4124 domain-containing protein [Cycloclasticus sp.]|nr:MAG: DUF4124 domain-containing protein [Cycloclasticus sp.]